MSDSIDTLVSELLDWIGTTPRTYREVMDAWRTSCPRLPIWEEANARGLIAQYHVPGAEPMVTLSESGVVKLTMHRCRLAGVTPTKNMASNTPSARQSVA